MIIASIVLFLGCTQKNQVKQIIKTETNINYEVCKKYFKVMNHASTYINKEFNLGYFNQKDLVGAKAQIFLIKNSSSKVFAKNINNANDIYLKEYKLAKKNRCKLEKFKITPISQIEQKILSLSKKERISNE